MSWVDEINAQYGGKPVGRSSSVPKWATELNESSIELSRRDEEDRKRKRQLESRSASAELVKKYNDEAKRASSGWGMTKNFIKAIPLGIRETFLGMPTKFAVSTGEVAEMAGKIIAGEAPSVSNRTYSGKILGKQVINPFKSFQSSYQDVSDRVIKGEAGMGSAAWELAQIPLAAADILGTAKGLSKAKDVYRAGGTLKQFGTEVADAFFPSFRKPTATQEVLESLNKPKPTATQQVLEATGFTRRAIGEGVQSSKSPEIQNAVRDVHSYIIDPKTGVSAKTVDTLRKQKLLGDLEFDKNGNTTLYREGAVTPGEVQSFSKTKKWDAQTPVVINKNDIIADTTSDGFHGLYKTNLGEKTPTGNIESDINLEALKKYNDLEGEVLVKSQPLQEGAEMVPGLKSPKAPEAPKSPSKIAIDIRDDFQKKGIIDAVDDGELPGYNKSTVEVQNTKIKKIVDEDFDRFKRLVSGEETDETLKGGMLLKYAEDYVKKTGDTDMAYRITRSPLLGEGSEAASELRFFAERDPDSALAQITALRRARELAAKTKLKNGASLTKETISATKEVRRAAAQETWGSFIDSIKC